MFAFRLMVLGLVFAPVLLALVVELLLDLRVAAPLMAIGAGFAWCTLGTKTAGDIYSRAADAGISDDDLWKGEPQEVIAREPLLLAFPMLWVGGNLAIAIGCIWLVLVDYKVGLAATGVIALLVLKWTRSRPRFGGAASGR